MSQNHQPLFYFNSGEGPSRRTAAAPFQPITRLTNVSPPIQFCGPAGPNPATVFQSTPPSMTGFFSRTSAFAKRLPERADHLEVVQRADSANPTAVEVQRIADELLSQLIVGDIISGLGVTQNSLLPLAGCPWRAPDSIFLERILFRAVTTFPRGFPPNPAGMPAFAHVKALRLVGCPSCLSRIGRLPFLWGRRPPDDPPPPLLLGACGCTPPPVLPGHTSCVDLPLAPSASLATTLDTVVSHDPSSPGHGLSFHPRKFLDQPPPVPKVNEIADGNHQFHNKNHKTPIPSPFPVLTHTTSDTEVNLKVSQFFRTAPHLLLYAALTAEGFMRHPASSFFFILGSVHLNRHCRGTLCWSAWLSPPPLPPYTTINSGIVLGLFRCISSSKFTARYFYSLRV